MPVTKGIVRGIQNIKTITGRAEKGLTYKAYMRLSILEMEKHRRGKEKSSALVRVANIDTRFQDIEKEKMEILKTLVDQDLDRISGKGGPSVTPKKATGAFKIRY